MFFYTFFANLRNVIFSCLTGFSLVLLGGCGDTPTTQKNTTGQLIFGMLAADPPFMSINNQGHPEGFDVDVAHEIGRLLNTKVIIKDMGVSELFVALDRHRIDLMMCGLSITPARLKKINMVHYQGEGITTYPLVFWDKVPAGVRTMDDLRGKSFTLAVLPATTQETFAQQFDFVTIKSMPSYSSIVMDLQYRKVNAALFDSAITGFIKKFPQLHVVNVPLGTFEERGHGIAINKTNEDLTRRINLAMQHLKNDGTIARLEKRWHMNQESTS